MLLRCVVTHNGENGGMPLLYSQL